MAKQKQNNQVVFDYEPDTFSIISNYVYDDKQITPAAGHLYGLIRRWITYRVDGFVCSKSFIASKYNAGSRMFNRAWDELKELGYLKMYSHPTNGWKARLLTKPEPETAHTYYLDLNGEVKSTNVERAAKKAEKEAEKDHYPENHPNGDHYLQNVPNGDHYLQNDSNGNDSNGNVGNNINTLINDSYNNFYNDSLNQSINQSNTIDIDSVAPEEEKEMDRTIDKELIEKIEADIDVKQLAEVYNIPADEVALAVDIIAELRTINHGEKIGGRNISARYIREVAESINCEHVNYAFQKLYERSDVQNVRAYMRTTLFNAPSSMGAYYANKAYAPTFKKSKKSNATPFESSFDTDDFFNAALRRSYEEAENIGDRV